MINIIIMITLVKLGRHYHDNHHHYDHLGQTWYDQNLVQCKGLELVLNVVPSGGLCLGQDPGGDGGYHGDRADDGGYRGDRGYQVILVIVKTILMVMMVAIVVIVMMALTAMVVLILTLMT